MTKALVIRCDDPRLNPYIPTVASILRMDSLVEYPLPGPDGIFRDPERTRERDAELAGIRKLLSTNGPFDAVAIISHTDCQDHDVPCEKHRQDTQLAAMLLRDSMATKLPVHSLLALRGEADDDWIFEDLGKK